MARSPSSPHATTVRLAPPYWQETHPKVVSPGWHRLPSTAWFGANVLLSGAVVLIFTVDRHLPWISIILLVAAFVAAIGSFVAAVRDASRRYKPIAPIINLVATLLINPYMVLGYSVWLGVLDFS